MPDRRFQHGIMLLETLVASTGAILLGGTFLLFINVMSQTYQAQMTLSELSGYVDVAMFHLKRDIWKSVQAQVACPNNPQPSWTDWLALQEDPAGWGAGEDICYMLDPTTAGNIRLVRWRWQGGAWTGQRAVAQRLVADPDPAVLDTDADPTAWQGVTVRLTTSRTVFGRGYTRSQPALMYRFQLPCPAGGCP